MSSFLTPADLHVSSSSFQTGPQGPLKPQNSGAIVFFKKTLHTLHNVKTRSITSHLGHEHAHPVSCTPAKTSRQLWQITTLSADSENSWGSFALLQFAVEMERGGESMKFPLKELLYRKETTEWWSAQIHFTGSSKSFMASLKTGTQLY